jgi:hypothetical protein|tara:strand:+ start:55 stop:492 length:438 start_codon:yes stop_codon:yes gene_type:complete
MKKVVITILLITGLFSQNKDDDLLLGTVGYLSAQGIYLTYSSIGTTADGYATGTYDSDFAYEFLSELIDLSQNTIDQLTLLITSGILSNEDITYVAQLITGYKFLISEAEAYNQYVRTDDEKYLDEYNKYREQAWDLISEILGFE